MRSKVVPNATPIVCIYLPEPLLRFGDDGLHIDPKSGIARYGPRSWHMPSRHPAIVRVGIIGTAETTGTACRWLQNASNGITGNLRHPEFPGYRNDRGFFSTLLFEDAWTEQITQSELRGLLDNRRSRQRFEGAVALVDHKLRLLSEQDQPPQYVVIALPDALVRQCRSVTYRDKDLGEVHRNLRTAIKSAAMKYHLPTQLLSQQVSEGRDNDNPAKIAWNYFTGLYTKTGGMPWSPNGLTPSTCYVGIAFYRPLGTKHSTLCTSLVQAFDERGEGLVLRGHDIEWDPDKEESRSPHLTEQQAHDLIDMVLTRYRAEMGQSPQRVVVHKTSRYWQAERSGFQAALGNQVNRYDLVALEQQSAVRLITKSKYPPLRGTAFSIGGLDFLYTTGYIADLEEYHAMAVPSPLRIADHIGQDTSRENLLRETLILTKMNWNSAHFAGSLPITLKFSRLVGDIMREIPPDRIPLTQYKYYM